eukprot:9709931-Alexandrium_andersonii.AAC.1
MDQASVARAVSLAKRLTRRAMAHRECAVRAVAARWPAHVNDDGGRKVVVSQVLVLQSFTKFWRFSRVAAVPDARVAAAAASAVAGGCGRCCLFAGLLVPLLLLALLRMQLCAA